MSYKSFLGRGFLLGLAVGMLLVASRRRIEVAPRLIHWERVRRIAIKVSRYEAEEPAIPYAEMTDRYTAVVQRSEEMISRYTGRPLNESLVSVRALSREDWIDANIASFQQIFEPMERLNRQALAGRSMALHLLGGVSQFVLSNQLGLLMGYLARRVLGQYDLGLLGKEPITSGRLYFVEPNVRELQRRLHLDDGQFRLWISLHETTHAHEFQASPWLRDYMNSLLIRYFESASATLVKVQRGRGSLAEALGHLARTLLRGDYLVEWMMTSEQRQIFRQLQALMSLIEGYSNHVMQEVGRSLLPSYATIKARFEARWRQRGALEHLFARIMGLDIKMEQYRLGEWFVNQVVRQRGIEFMNQVWSSPEALPTLEEVRQPQRWIDRIDRQAI